MNDQELLQELKKQQRNNRKWLVVFAVVAFTIQLLIVGVSLVFIDSDFIARLQNENASIQRNYDYLQFVVPVLLAMGAFMATALGINRLKGLDEEVEKIESDLSKKFGEYEKNTESRIETTISSQIELKSKTFVERLKSETSAGKKDLSKIADDSRKAIKEKETAALGALEARYDGFDDKMTQTTDLIDRFNKEYSWLKNDGVIDPDSIVVESVADAHAMVENLFRKIGLSKNERVQHVNVIIKRVLSEKIVGDSADYHNLAAELARNELKGLAVKVCEIGLNFFGSDVDLIADIIQYAASIGEKAAGIKIDRYVERLERIPKVSWTWRCFEFLSDYYLSCKNYTKAKEICELYIEYLPRDERGYAQLAEVYGYILYGIRAEDKKIEILESAVKLGFTCPRCANALAGLYADRGNLDEAIRYSSIALISLAQPQPSVNYAYVLYHRALYEDRLYLKKKLEGTIDCDLRKEAMRDYREAIATNLLTPITNSQAKVRHNLLALDDSQGTKIEETDTASTVDLLELLSRLTPDQEDSDDE